MPLYRLVTRDQQESFAAGCQVFQGILTVCSNERAPIGERSGMVFDFEASGYALADDGIRFDRPPGKWPGTSAFIKYERLKTVYCDGVLIWKAGEMEAYQAYCEGRWAASKRPVEFWRWRKTKLYF